MNQELETAAAASAGGWLRWRKQHTVAPGSLCANCSAVLQGPYCHQCGQLAEDFHRSLSHLVVEGLESLFHFDGRLWRTIPLLIRNPGQLTRDYLEGRRAYQIPPLRMFLVVLLLVFFCGGLGRHDDKTRLVVVDPKDRTAQGIKMGDKAGSPNWREEVRSSIAGKASPGAGKATATWFVERVIKAADNPEQFAMVMEMWAHRLAVLMLPIGALLLSGLFVFQRRFFVFDHLIFTMHSLSFQGLLISLYFVIALASSGIASLLWLAAPVHLFVHMRGVYRTGIVGTLIRMTLLFWGSLIAFTLLMAALVLIGLNAVGGH